MKNCSAILCLMLLYANTTFGQIAVKFDASKTGAPISKYIYGQFIEHLGKSIYGGLWAEMLEDRKFFFPVSDEYDPYGTREDRNWNSGPFQYLKGSPWKPIGQQGLASMDKEFKYAGEHSLCIVIPGSGSETGVSQENLSVVAGRN